MTYEITLSNGLKSKLDEADYLWANRLNWCFKKSNGKYYAQRRHGGRLSYLHREIMDAQPGQVIDHINGDTLDNRRANLRICTHQQNCTNQTPQKRAKSSRFKGVSQTAQYYHSKKHGLREYLSWRAYIVKDDKQISLGTFRTELEAAQAYNAAALIYHGEYARLNIV